ncbi:amino acid adenylation domain-containing protein [Labrys neptuniae]|uniref:Pls/PosA family non-ribosomal peptide synthetase n=1 Tax=Labrys neptuniae TaxID=376174 RepID=UPI00288E9513|nr:Pls/PosA family non-ribosomal peptide synthetase [Labrys neptuniae]MDT3379478.1 amino acid adenylation domain-containing protein [Labrys neptuniae]
MLSFPVPVNAAGPLAVVRGEQRPDLLRDETLATIFKASAAAFPDKQALGAIGTGERLTYRELDERSDRVAAALARRGVGAGMFVGLWFQRSIDLHVALLGLIKTGASFIPFDADIPPERVTASLADAGAGLLISHAPQAEKYAAVEAGTVTLEALLADTGREVPAGPAPALTDAAYAIYTSGTSGKPKGIKVSHRNICHYLRAGNERLRIAADDVVLQQASIAFDLSLEEIFIPYMVGATLKIASAAVLQDIDALPQMLEAEGITVIDTVPTLLSMLSRDVAGLNTIILGGEACPPALVARFARPGRRLLNTYGPTETTVVATSTELEAGDDITIGRPIPNYTAYVVDDQLNLLAPGETGELLVGGPGVAMGYLNLPEMTAAKFIANPFALDGSDPVLYRTGDAVSLKPDGRIVFQGRIDSQVKIRGYRIELGEIESLLAADRAIRTAVVTANQSEAGDTLVAHLVPRGEIDLDRIKRDLAAKIPRYMLPSAFQLHDALPVLPSGKVDRKALSSLPVPERQATAGEQEPPRSWTEAQLLKAAQELLRAPAVDFEADFFTDLGGHSLLAARFVSEVRRVPALSGIAIRDLYTHRTLRNLARALDESAAAAAAAPPPDRSFEPVPLARRFLCGLAQAVTLPFIVALVSVQWIGLLLASMLLVGDNASILTELAVLCGVYICLNLATKLAVIGLKWLVIGRTRPGVYPLWGAYYFRIWLMQRIVQLTTPKFLKGSPLIRVYLRALGARIGHDAMIDDFEEGAIDLVTIGDRASLGTKLKLANVEVIGNEVHVGRIKIGTGARIGNGSVIGGDVVIGDGAEIGDLTALPQGTMVAPGTHWEGAPAAEIGPAEQDDPADHPHLGRFGRFVQAIGYFIAYNLCLVIGLLPIFPAFSLFSEVEALFGADPDQPLSWSLVAVAAWPAALALIVVSMAVMVALRWLLLPKVREGSYSIFGSLYFRKWVIGLSTESLLETLNSLYATVFMRNWYRMMGAKIGKGTEISASFAGRYDLIEMGRDNFIGDETIFGDEEIRNGRMILKRLKTGDRCFFGNSSVVSQGSVVEDDALIGIKSRLPDSLKVGTGETWLGSPPIAMPTRQKVAAAAGTTYAPPFRMKLLRVVFETLHTSLPTAVLIAAAYITADILASVISEGAWLAATGIFLVAGLAISGLMYLAAVAVKWLLIGTYKPMMRPMWSWWAMRTEGVAVIYGGLASKMLLDYLRGTPFLPWLLRPFGAKIGKGTWINTTDICEFDCTEIGDHAVLNMGACPQTHLYEDRVMKVGRIRIGRGATIGTGATVLYDTEIGPFAQVELLTLIMKGEALPTSTVWTGIPAQAQILAPANAEAHEPARTPVLAEAAE